MEKGGREGRVEGGEMRVERGERRRVNYKCVNAFPYPTTYIPSAHL